MHRIIIIFLLAIIATSTMARVHEWEALQADLGRQAAAFRNSPEHLEARNRDTRDYQVGDTNIFWRWNLSVMPPLWIQTPATCRAVGEHCYIFVADNEWNVHMDQTDVDAVLARLEDSTVNDPSQGAIEMDVQLFGPIPDELDNDPRLIVFYSALGSFQGTSFDGYFSPYNQVTEAQAQQMNPPGHSNLCEMIYMTCYPLDPVAPIRLSVLAHELQHLIHWGQDANEDTWLNEGCSELAMVAYGVPDPISGFNSVPDNNLTAWNQTTADYVKVMLFFTYLQEHYDATGMIGDLVADPANGIASLNAQLAIHYPDTSFSDLFSNWGVANILDAGPPLNPLWGYSLLDLPNFTMTNLPVEPSMSNLGIQGYATDYLRYTCQTSANHHIGINFGTPVRIKEVKLASNGECLDVTDLGESNSFLVTPPPSSEAFHVIYVLSNPNPNPVVYSLMTAVPNDDPSAPELESLSLSANHPNPFRAQTLIQFSIREAQALKLEVFNLRGQKVATPVDGLIATGDHQVSWNGLDYEGQKVPAGVYLYRLTAGKTQITRRMAMY